jgi:hypothetical protein
MNWNFLVKLGETLVDMFWKSCDVKRFVIYLLEKYAKSTDNEVDNMLVDIVRSKLLVNCPEQ